MPASRQFIVARDGWLPLALVLVVGIALFRNIAAWTLLPTLLLVGVVVIMYRNPHRAIPPIPQGVVSPMDGKLEFVGTARCPYLEQTDTSQTGYHLRIRRRWWSPYYIRSPIEGQVCELVGENKPDGVHAWRIFTDEGDTVVMQMSGDHFLSDRSFRPRYGERIGQGQRAGTRLLGSVVDIWLPENARILVDSGDKVASGTDVLAKLVHNNV